MARRFSWRLPEQPDEPVVKTLSLDAALKLCGWLGQDIAKQHFDLLGGSLPTFMISGSVGDYQGKRQMLWEFTRKVLGKDTENYAQEIGDCVSFGGKNVIEHLQCVEIALAGQQEKFKNMYPPYFYGTSRVQVGGGGLRGDGSTGTWLQEAIKQYGALASDTPGVPDYSGAVAKKWGSSGPPEACITVGQQHLVKTTAQIKTADAAANALLNGYPIAVCSDQGFNMNAGSDGFHAPHGSWGHCMTITGFDDSDSSKGLYFIILNSWGDVHGRLKDFASGADLPMGILRVKGQVVGKMLSQGDSFAYSQFDGFPDNSEELQKALFDLVGD